MKKDKEGVQTALVRLPGIVGLVKEGEISEEQLLDVEDEAEKEVEEVLQVIAENPIQGCMALNGALPALFRAHTPSLEEMCSWENKNGLEQLSKAQQTSFELLYNGVELQISALLSMGAKKDEIISAIREFVLLFEASREG